MKLKKEQLKKIKKFSMNHIKKNDFWHRLFHIEQTVKISKALAKKEKADVNKCIISAWLHDISKNHEKNKIDHGNVGARLSEQFLKKLKFSEKDIQEICYAIKEHNKGGKKKTKEASILWDADKIQAIGAYGILRGYGNFLKTKKNHEEAYKEALNEQKFFIKRFRTRTGRKLARKKFKFMEKFDKEYEEILNLKI